MAAGSLSPNFVNHSSIIGISSCHSSATNWIELIRLSLEISRPVKSSASSVGTTPIVFAPWPWPQDVRQPFGERVSFREAGPGEFARVATEPVDQEDFRYICFTDLSLRLTSLHVVTGGITTMAAWPWGFTITPTVPSAAAVCAEDKVAPLRRRPARRASVTSG